MFSLANTCIFCAVIFFYLHIYFHVKTSNELEVYNLNIKSKEELEEICDFKQPLTFSHTFTGNIMYINRDFIKTNYSNKTVSLRDNTKLSLDSPIYSFIDLNSAFSAIKSNKVIENNEDFLKNTALIGKIKENDSFIRPYLLAKSSYDIVIGENNSHTPLKYEVNYRNFFYLTEGSVKIKLACPKSGLLSNSIKDYELLEFRSAYNPWIKNKTEIECIEIELNAGEILFIPAYWWYSILFCEPSTILSFKYQTYASMLSVFPEYFLHFLQKNNIKQTFSEKRKVVSPSYLDNLSKNTNKSFSKMKSCIATNKNENTKKKSKEQIKLKQKKSKSPQIKLLKEN